MATMRVTVSFEVEAERGDQLRAAAHDVLQRIAHNVGLNGSDLETDVRDRSGLRVGHAKYDFAGGRQINAAPNWKCSRPVPTRCRQKTRPPPASMRLQQIDEQPRPRRSFQLGRPARAAAGARRGAQAIAPGDRCH